MAKDTRRPAGGFSARKKAQQDLTLRNLRAAKKIAADLNEQLASLLVRVEAMGNRVEAIDDRVTGLDVRVTALELLKEPPWTP